MKLTNGKVSERMVGNYVGESWEFSYTRIAYFVTWNDGQNWFQTKIGSRPLNFKELTDLRFTLAARIPYAIDTRV